MASILKFNQAQHTNGTNSYSIGSDGLIKPKNLAFQVSGLNIDTSYTASSYLKLTFPTVELDTGGYWDSVNNRYTPQVAGWYLFGGTVRIQTTSSSLVAFKIAKNGVTNTGLDLPAQFQTSADIFTNGEYPMPTGMLQLNGTGDYVESWFQTEENCTITDATSRKSYFWGMLVHAT